MRVHELAKKLGKSSKEVIADLNAKGIPAKTHMSVVPDDAAGKKAGVTKAKKAAPKKTVRVAKVAEPVKKKTTRAKKALKPVEVKPSPKPEPLKVEKAPAKEVAPPPAPASPPAPEKPKKPAVTIALPITVGEFARSIKVTVPVLIKTVMGLGIFANVNQVIDEAIVKRTAAALDIPIEVKVHKEEVVKLIAKADRPEDLVLRCPVVTMMGHVDHGKTSLLDAIRKSNVAENEAGKITQHIGAYEVRRGDDKFITFVDTPGHAAFTAMRARGANVTDVVVLVVAADDGVKPQTIEAIDHAKAAQVPIVVAINKVDLSSSNPDRVRKQLQKYGLEAEDWGGKTIMISVSAKTGKGIDQLLESLLLEAEVLELKANPKQKGYGTVVEGRISKGEGPTATIIVRNGSFSVGDPVVCGAQYGKLRAIRNNLTPRITKAIPAQAVELSGISGVPEAADEVHVVGSLSEARSIAEKRQEALRERQLGLGRQKHLRLDDLHSKISEGTIKDLKLVIKTDTQGSLEALVQQLEKLSKPIVRLHVIHGATGAISESDVMLAAASDAVIIGFHVKAGPQIEDMVDKEGIDLRHYDVIYDVVNDITKAMEGLLEPTLKEVFAGRAEIRKTFSSSKVGTIGGAYVTKGVIARKHKIRLIRGGKVIHEGKLGALRRFKDDAREVKEGFECGVSFAEFNDLRVRDILESYQIESVASKLT